MAFFSTPICIHLKKRYPKNVLIANVFEILGAPQKMTARGGCPVCPCGNQVLRVSNIICNAVKDYRLTDQ